MEEGIHWLPLARQEGKLPAVKEAERYLRWVKAQPGRRGAASPTAQRAAKRAEREAPAPPEGSKQAQRAAERVGRSPAAQQEQPAGSLQTSSDR